MNNKLFDLNGDGKMEAIESALGYMMFCVVTGEEESDNNEFESEDEDEDDD